MSRQQWGHGFHKGKEEGEKWGELVTDGKWETELCEISDQLMLLAQAMRYPLSDRKARTDAWWALHTSAAAKRIQEIAETLPGLLTGVHEFEQDVPGGKGPDQC